MSSLSDQTVWVQGQPVEVPAGRWPAGQTPRALLRLAGPIQPAWRTALRQAGLQVRFWCPPTGACVQMPEALQRQPANLARLAFVVGGLDFTEAMCQRFPEARPGGEPAPGAAADATAASSGLPASWYDLVCFDQAAVPAVRQALTALKAEVLDAGSTKLRVHYLGPVASLRRLAGVKLVDAAQVSSLLAAPARAVRPTVIPTPSAAAAAASAPRPPVQALRAAVGAWPPPPVAWALDGAGEVIAICDTGLDSGDPQRRMHPDLAGRIRALVAWPMNPAWQALATLKRGDAADRGNGHGTHVAGLACGSGRQSNGLQGGIAPAAELVFQAIEQEVAIRPGAPTRLRSGFQLSGRPLDLRELYRASAGQGALLHNISWGNATRGAYADDCFETDLFLHENPQAVVVCAAGNDGVDADGDRRIDSGSLYAPACAKNTIAVGATEGPLLGTGPRATWADLDAAGVRWPLPADRQDAVSGEPDRIAPISSCGPTPDGRTKPDLVAPGISLPSTRSRASSAQGWGLADPMPHYMYLGGTSMAAPVVAGALALVRQAWRRARRQPSGAALKALLLLGCQPVRGRGSAAAAPTECGFGRLSVAHALPPLCRAVPGWRVALRDARALQIDTGARREVLVVLRGPSRLRAVLCWTDPPGERLVNDLDLALVDTDGRTLARGGVPVQGPAPDRTNPVECLDLPALPAGRYRLQVAGHNVMDGPQRYALAWAIEPAPD